MVNILVIACTILLIALIGTVIAAKKGWLADRDKDGIADVIEDRVDIVKDKIDDVVDDVEDFIEDMTKVFPTLGNDWGVYMPEVKYLSPEPLVDYDNLSLKTVPNIHFVGDALSARGITVSGAQGTYVAESILNNE